MRIWLYKALSLIATVYLIAFPTLQSFGAIILATFISVLVIRASTVPEKNLKSKSRKNFYPIRPSFIKNQTLTEIERSELDLSRHLEQEPTNVELGRRYERFVGYLLESEGYHVTFEGAIKGSNDQGRDLIAHKNNETLIVQAKCWAKSKLIFEAPVYQLLGTTTHYKNTNPNRKNVKAVLCSTTNLSDRALSVAKSLEIEIRYINFEKSYPMIKCNINENGKRIFHLPCDPYYDKVKIDIRKGEFYARTVKEAISNGFRRAYKYRGSKTA
jgi:hypothetical protein